MAARTIGTREWPAGSAPRGAADWICLAAAPCFAIMALLTGAAGEVSRHMLCSVTPAGPPLGGMTWMYALMSVFHMSPWLTLITTWRGNPRRP
jgi:hypothetical protein